MGADMLVEVLSWDKDQKLDWEAGIKYLNGLDDEVIEKNEDLPPGSDKESILSSLKLVRQAVEGDLREAVILHFGNLKILLTGGMSWGDSPSELYDDMYDMECIAGLFDAIGFNQDEFDYKSILMKVLKVLKDSKQLPVLLHLDKHLDAMLEAMLKSGKKRS
jgi:hypothetical protein